jgi:D-sedoheptulose 7-phosphate isomerase
MKFDQYIDYTFDATKKVDSGQVEEFINLLFKAYKEEKTVFVIGNGGSAASATHLAQDLAKGTRAGLEYPKRVKAVSLTDNVAFITALGNDDGYDTIFEQQLRTFAKPGDYVIAISGSGNSPNIIKAINWANENGLITVGVTGFNGGKLKTMNAYSLHVDLNDMCTAESIHTIIFHYVAIELQRRIKEDALA